MLVVNIGVEILIERIQMYIFLTVCYWISFAMMILFGIKGFCEDEKYYLHEWLACAFSLIFLLLRRLL